MFCNDTITCRHICCTDEFSVLNPPHTFVSDCFISLLLDVPGCLLGIMWLSFVLDSVTSTSITSTLETRNHVVSGRLVLYMLGVVAAAARFCVFASLTDGWCVSHCISSVLPALTWLFLALVSCQTCSRTSSVSTGATSTHLITGLLALLSVFHLVAEALDYYRDHSNLPLGYVICDGLQIVVACSAGIVSLRQSSPSHALLTQLNPLPHLGTAEDGSSWLSRLVFGWVQPLMRRGYSRALLTVDDVFHLPSGLRTDVVDARFAAAVRHRLSAQNTCVVPAEVDNEPIIPLRSPAPVQLSLVRVMISCFGLEYFLLGGLRLLADLSTFAGPLLLNAILSLIENPQEPVSRGYVYVSIIFAANLVSALSITQYDYLMDKVGLKVRASFVTAIYRKILSVPIARLAKFNSGEIMTYMGVDVDRVANLCNSFHAFWSLPFQFGVALYLLYWQIGISFLAGLGFTILLVPINKYISSKIGEYSTGMLEHKDERVKLMSEVLHGINTIKLSFWEIIFSKRIDVHRKNELRYLKKQKFLDAWCVFFWATTPVIMCLLTFGTYVLLGGRLTAPTVFTTIALLNILKNPINAFPWALNGLVDALVSLKRVQNLLALPDMDPLSYFCESDNLPASHKSAEVVVNRGFFHWGEGTTSSISPDNSATVSYASTMSDLVFPGNNVSPIALWDVTLHLERGQLVGVMGPVGCGKSSLMHSILGELVKDDGVVYVAGRSEGVGFVAQESWIQEGTLRDNILFGAEYNSGRYRAVLDACALTQDLEALPDSDRTRLTQSGSNLSGGQRVRVALARAVYQNYRVYLLDDILSSVDPPVARHILTHCVRGLLRDRTVIICGHQSEVMRRADWVVMMERGWISRQGHPADVLPEEEPGSTRPSDRESSTSDTADDGIAEDSTCSGGNHDEDMEQGSVSWAVCSTYYSAVGVFLAPLILLMVVCMQVSRNATDLWLGYYVSPDANTTRPALESLLGLRVQPGVFLSDAGAGSSSGSSSEFFRVYGSIAALNALFTFLRAFLFAYGGVRAAKAVHARLLRAVLAARPAFFSSNPAGRILNRFSSDLYTVDSSLPFILNIFLAQLSGLLGILVVTVIGLPWISLLFLPLGIVYCYIQNYYRHTSRQLKRLSTVALSPVYSHFVETLSGLATIRALQGRDRLILEHMEILDRSQRARFSTQASVAWLNLRLQLMGVTMVTGVALLGVSIRHLTHSSDAGLIGLAISYALSVTGSLSGLVSSFTETEKEMVSMERIQHYADVEAEADVEDTQLLPDSWPQAGQVDFNNVHLTYTGCSRSALSGISFTLPPGTSLGVVGRTGAGKSSLLAALLRAHPVSAGDVRVDGVDVRDAPLHRIRAGISVLPQRPFLFDGTLRDNLDPGGSCSEQVLLAAVAACRLDSSLDTAVGQHGCQLSLGQRQLVCLARALLRQSHIVCLDEATANLDAHTDQLIQVTLQESFRDRTVISISHRISAVIWCDLVMVLHEGRLVELAPPASLLEDSTSAFHALFRQQQSNTLG